MYDEGNPKSVVLCDNLGWGGGGIGGIHEGGDIHMPMANSYCCMAKTIRK